MQERTYCSAMVFEQFAAAAGKSFPHSDEWLVGVPEFLRKLANRIDLRRLIRVSVGGPGPWTLDLGEGRRLPYQLEGTGCVKFIALPNSYRDLDFATDYYSERARMASRRNNTESPAEAYRDPETHMNLLQLAYRNYARKNPETVPRRCTESSETMARFFVRQAIYQTLKECGNFKVSFAAQIYTFFGATAVLDPFAGWGDRAIAAALVPTVRRYLGVDCNPDLVEPYRRIRETFDGVEFRVPERFEDARVQIPYGFDLVLASPPFYDLELYGSGPTAQTQFPEVNDWVDQWLVPCLLKAIGALVTGGYLVLYLCDTQRYAGKRYVGRCHDELLLSCGRLLQFLGVVATLREKDSSRVMPLLVYRKIL